MDSVRPSLDPGAGIAMTRASFGASLRGGDAVGAASAYTDDARLLAPSAELISGRASIARFWQAGLDAGLEAMEVEALHLEVEPGGTTATEIGRYVLLLISPTGGRLEDRGRYLIVHRREDDGTWRRAAETFSPDEPGSTGTPSPARTR
jgi:ketosteroid isomerase-like protein